MSKTFCPLPWMHLGTHPHGGVTPCCISDMTAGKNRARNFTDNGDEFFNLNDHSISCLLYTSPSPRDATLSRMPSSA